MGHCKIFILSFCTHHVVDFLGRLWNRGTHPQPNCQNLCFYRNVHTCWWSVKIKCSWLAAPGCSYQSIRGELFTGLLRSLSFSHDCVHHSLSLACCQSKQLHCFHIIVGVFSTDFKVVPISEGQHNCWQPSPLIPLSNTIIQGPPDNASGPWQCRAPINIDRGLKQQSIQDSQRDRPGLQTSGLGI